MPLLHRLNALQNELREILRMDTADYRLEVTEKDVRAQFIGLRLSSAFQPVFDLDAAQPAGFEALLRASDADGEPVDPPQAFVHAEISGDLVKLDRLCRTLHTLNYLNMGRSTGLLFLNVHPELLAAVSSHGKVFERVLHSYALPTSGVVIEIDEGAVSRKDLLDKAVSNYRERGYRVAVDNFGRAHFDLNRILALSPQYVKFDGSFIRRAEADERLRRSLPQLVAALRDLGAEVVFTGVETESQLELARHAGAGLAQGWLLGRPAPAMSWGDEFTPPVLAGEQPVARHKIHSVRLS